MSAMKVIWPQIIFFLCLSSAVTAAAEQVSKEESQQYYFSLMQKAKTFTIEAKDAGNYLRGVWRLDKKAHVAGGHYIRADKGDDVTLICNSERLIQVDFNQNHAKFHEVTRQFATLKVNEDGSLSFDRRRKYIPLDDKHMAVAAYDYIVLLQRVSGRAQSSVKKEKKGN